MKYPWRVGEKILNFEYIGNGRFMHEEKPITLRLEHIKGETGTHLYANEGYVGNYSSYAAMFLNTWWNFDPTNIYLAVESLYMYKEVNGKIPVADFDVWQASLVIMYELFTEKESVFS